MQSNDPILVIGHRNPDTDAIASAVAYACVLGQSQPEVYAAGRCGQVNMQTEFALSRFGVEAPPFVADVRPRVGDVTESVATLNDSQSLLEACQLVARTKRPATILDSERHPLGLLSGEELFASFADALSSTSILALAREFERPAPSALDTSRLILKQDVYIQDILTPVLRDIADDYVVVDSNDRYVGLTRKSALLAPPRRRVVMVDHNEPGQAVTGLEGADVVEVLDHHRLSTVPTAVPIRFQIEPVGSTSTLVMERAEEEGVTFPPGIAGLLLSGILSDTLIFRSPTVTDRDRRAALQLARAAGLSTSENEADVLAAIESYGNELLAAGAGLGTRPVEEILNTDIKFYEVGGERVGISQVEVTNFREIAGRLEELRGGLNSLLEREKLAMALVMITDVVRGNSRLLAVGQQRILAALPYPRMADEMMDAPGLVSRKKQLLPTVLGALQQVL
ncbi:MAG TPA: DHHA2 domain-containing protein [Candidatus Limnocylindrales bacterium]|nr:DHHA2 domain-containing protein [Candidatus Limnocylindrales bacterium]